MPQTMARYGFTLPQMKTPLKAAERRRVGCLWIARLMAHSGWHEDYRTIEVALRKEYPEAAVWLQDNAVRDELGVLCFEARAAVGADPTVAYAGLELSASPKDSRRMA
jgi:hypothetical protein